MGIAVDDVQRVRAASDFVQIAGEHIALKRVGRRYVGLCPFHAEKTPSFSVNAEEGLYYCFGCGAKGDVITFVRELEHLEFVEAVERLAARAGIQVRFDDVAATAERRHRDRLLEAMERAVEWYHERLLTGPDAAAARGYLRARGYDGEVVRFHKIGWAPDDWDALSRALRLPDQVLSDTGLGFVNRRQRQQDQFRARVMFPVFDVRGDPVAFGGRSLPGGPPPKYRNSPETPLYRKSRVLYGLNWAKAAVVQAGEVLVCEGYTDVIGLRQVGLPHAVATCGTALADEHFHVLKNFARRVVLAYDADAAGQAAAERFYEWERRYEVDIAVAALPAGSDPGDLARRDPDALRLAVERAQPFLAFRLERVLASADLRSAEGRARAAEASLAVVREHPSDLVRDQYLMQVADRLGIGPDRLRPLLQAQAGKTSRATPNPSGGFVRRVDGSVRVGAWAGPEVEALRLAIHRPEEVAGRLHDALFDDEVVAAAHRALVAAGTLHGALEAADPVAGGLLQRLAVEDVEGTDPDDVLARLAQEAASRALGDLERAARSADDPLAFAPSIEWLKVTLEELRQSPGGEGAVATTETLVRWLVERLEVEE